MSVFMLSDDVFSAIARALATIKAPTHNDHPLACVVRPARKLAYNRYDTRNLYKLSLSIVASWREANARAVNARYSNPKDMGTDTMGALSLEGLHMSMVELYKNLQALAYQCSETVPKAQERKHKRAQREIEALIAYLAPGIVEDLDAYKVAGWGSVDERTPEQRAEALRVCKRG